jgi:hypothetical protein
MSSARDRETLDEDDDEDEARTSTAQQRRQTVNMSLCKAKG